MDFPQYRKLGERVFYRIRDDRNFDEIQLVGSKAILHHIHAEQYPEILRIREMLDFELDGIVASTQEEFESLQDKFGF